MGVVLAASEQSLKVDVVRPHRITSFMRPSAADGVAWSVCSSVTAVSHAKRGIYRGAVRDID